MKIQNESNWNHLSDFLMDFISNRKILEKNGLIKKENCFILE
jgi:hypothetical protein